MFIDYLAYEGEFDSIQEFFENNKRNYKVVNSTDYFGLEDFKETLKTAKEDLAEAGYTDEEIHSILENYRKGRRLGKIESIEMLLKGKFNSVPEKYKKQLRNKSRIKLDRIINIIFDIEDIEELEEYL
ncbi:hypothetical protein [Halarsenatibacter silvermanii]|nr:hypothetical protein [Halarsenatibacter silvermanii]